MAQDPQQQARYGQFIHLMHDQKYEDAVAFALKWQKAGDGWAKARVDEWYGGGGDPEDAPPPVRRLVDQHLASAAGDPARLGEGVGWLDKAADQGSQEAIYILGSMSPQALAERGIQSKYAGRFLRGTR